MYAFNMLREYRDMLPLGKTEIDSGRILEISHSNICICLLYTSDAADE